MKKILISVNCLKEIGGIGTSAVNLINEIHDIYDLTLFVPTGYISSKYTIPSNVKIIEGSSYLRDVIIDRKFLSNQTFFATIRRNLRRLINHYFLGSKGIEYSLRQVQISGEFDVAIAFADFQYYKSPYEIKIFDYDIVLNNVKATKKIAWMHNDALKLGWTHFSALKCFDKFDAIVNVSYDGKIKFDNLVPELKFKSFVVYNMYDIASIRSKAETDKILYKDKNKIHFVTVARIQKEQKRVDRIILVCKRLIKEGYDNFDWTLVGNGEVWEMKEMSDRLGVTSVINFVGLQINPYPYIKQADAFVLSSEYEGLPMTLKESQIIGTPTLSTSFGSASEAIDVNRQGLICENSTEGLYNMIKTVLLERIKLLEFSKNLLDNPVTNCTALQQFKLITNI